MKDIRFSNEHTTVEAAGVVDVLRKPRLWIPTEKDYPQYDTWLGKTEADIASGKKRAMAAYMGQDAVGAVIYQAMPGQPHILEIRNISVANDARGRYFGAFLLRNTEAESARNDFPGVDEVTVDTKVTNTAMIAFLESQGYSIKEIADLYGIGTGLDAVLAKSLVK